MQAGMTQDKREAEDLPRLVPGISIWSFFPDKRDAEGAVVEHGTSIVGSRELDRFMTVPNQKLEAVRKILAALERSRSLEGATALLRSQGLAVDVQAFCRKLQKAGLIVDERGVPVTPDSDLERSFVRVASCSLEKAGPAFSWIGGRLQLILAAVFAFAALAFGLGQLDGVGRLSSLVPAYGFRLSLTWSDFAVALLILGGSFLFHELAHGIVAARFGLLPRKFEVGFYLGFLPTFYLRIGGLYTLAPRQRVAVWSAGPAANFLISLVAIQAAVHSTGFAALFWTKVAYLNIAFGLFNLLPFLPTDGYFIVSTLLRRSNIRRQAWAALRSSRTEGRRPAFVLLAYVAGASAAVVILLSMRLAQLIDVFPAHPIYAALRLALIAVFMSILVMRWSKRKRTRGGEAGVTEKAL